MNLLSAENLVSLVSLTALEIVLGIDNIVFVAILAEKLPAEQRKKARRLGLSLALGLRLGLLFTLSWIMGLTKPLFSLFGHALSGRDLVLLVGGIFLIGKSTHEIHAKVEGGGDAAHRTQRGTASFGAVLTQILLLDVVFSLDSVITAVGMARAIWVMALAMILAVGVMLASAERVSAFIHRHPTMKMLALSFLLLIGVLLVAEGFGKHIEKAYIYFAMGFALLVELLNIRVRRRSGPPVVAHQHHEAPTAPDRPPRGGA